MPGKTGIFLSGTRSCCFLESAFRARAYDAPGLRWDAATRGTIPAVLPLFSLRDVLPTTGPPLPRRRFTATLQSAMINGGSLTKVVVPFHPVHFFNGRSRSRCRRSTRHSAARPGTGADFRRQARTKVRRRDFPQGAGQPQQLHRGTDRLGRGFRFRSGSHHVRPPSARPCWTFPPSTCNGCRRTCLTSRSARHSGSSC